MCRCITKFISTQQSRNTMPILYLPNLVDKRPMSPNFSHWALCPGLWSQSYSKNLEALHCSGEGPWPYCSPKGMSFWPMRCNSCNFLIDASASCDFLKYIYARETEKKNWKGELKQRRTRKYRGRIRGGRRIKNTTQTAHVWVHSHLLRPEIFQVAFTKLWHLTWTLGDSFVSWAYGLFIIKNLSRHGAKG